MQITKDTTLNGKHMGDVNVERRATLRLSGMLTGDVRVDADGVGEINGMVNGNVFARRGSCVTIHGMVNGTVYNNGANVWIYGIVSRVVTLDGDAFIDPKAIVGIMGDADDTP
jgi:cytoskeletal protein CcmA (bactofilin family)